MYIEFWIKGSKEFMTFYDIICYVFLFFSQKYLEFKLKICPIRIHVTGIENELFGIEFDRDGT